MVLAFYAVQPERGSPDPEFCYPAGSGSMAE